VNEQQLANRTGIALNTLWSVLCLIAVVVIPGLLYGFDFVWMQWGFAASVLLVVLISAGLSRLQRALPELADVEALFVIPAVYFVITLVFYLFAEAIDQPHPDYRDFQSWITRSLMPASFLAVLVAAVVFVLVPFDIYLMAPRSSGIVFYPRIVELFSRTTPLGYRLCALAGLGAILGYYMQTVIEAWYSELGGGRISPPLRVFVTCNLVWAVLWVVDCINRRPRCTIIAATGYLVFALLTMITALGFAVLRE
jgi:hypothetical protein